MNEQEIKALQALKASKNYQDVCKETVERVFLEQLPKYKKLKDAEKAARTALHSITGAFLTPDELARAREAMTAWREGCPEALFKALSMHSSTRERLNGIDGLFDRILTAAGNPESVLDLACGLNPLYLGARGGLRMTGADINIGCVRLINECARENGWAVNAVACDLLSRVPEGEYDLTLAMKLLPVLESQKSGFAAALLENLRSRTICVTFPTRTLGGRGVGMEKHYSEWFESRVPANRQIEQRFVYADELVYILK